MLNGCAKTHETVFTARNDCIDLIDYYNSTNLRNPYNECLILKDDELRDKDYCKYRCNNYCINLNMTYLTSWPDFTGCNCNCMHNLKLK
jgi:hypothetical protein